MYIHGFGFSKKSKPTLLLFYGIQRTYPIYIQDRIHLVDYREKQFCQIRHVLFLTELAQKASQECLVSSFLNFEVC